MAKLVNRIEVARIAGVSPAAITKAARLHFVSAVVGPMLDLDNFELVKWLGKKDRAGARLAERLLAPTPPPPSPRPGRPVSAPCEPAQQAALPPRPLPVGDAQLDDIERYADLTLRELTTLFGTSQRFGEWLKARKQMSDIREKDLRHDERIGRLIPREYVRVHVVSYLDTLQRRLLQDAAATLTRRVYAMARGGVPMEEAEVVVRDVLGKEFREAKQSIGMALREAVVEPDVEVKAAG